MTITPVYAALLAVLFVGLSLRVIFLRNKFKIGIGDGGNKIILRAIRVQSNFAEYVPLALLLITFVEFRNSKSLLIHLLCGALLVGRILHATGVSQEKEPFIFRQLGMVLTFSSILISAFILIVTLLF